MRRHFCQVDGMEAALLKILVGRKKKGEDYPPTIVYDNSSVKVL